METPAGTGVFDSGAASAYAKQCVDQDPYRLPTPANDGISFITWSEYCGCESVEQLTMWFSHKHLYHILAERCIRIRVYEVPDHLVRKGDHQVVFIRREAEIVSEYDPIDFANRHLPKI